MGAPSSDGVEGAGPRSPEPPPPRPEAPAQLPIARPCVPPSLRPGVPPTGDVEGRLAMSVVPTRRDDGLPRPGEAGPPSPSLPRPHQCRGWGRPPGRSVDAGRVAQDGTHRSAD